MQKDDISILYVEDQEDIRMLLAEMLADRYTNIITAENGLEGLEKYKTYKSEIVITDIKMPKMNGLEMAQEIKKLNPKATIILTTAFNEMEYFVQSIELGVSGYLLKPIEMSKLFNVVEKCAASIINEHAVEDKNKEIEQLLHKTKLINEELEIITNNIPIAIIHFQADGKIIHVNKEYQQLFENDANKIILKDKLIEQIQPIVPHIIKGKNLHFTHKTSDNKILDVHLIPFYEENKQIQSFFALITDVTERTIAEEKLKWELKVSKALANLYKPIISAATNIQEISKIVLQEALNLTNSEHGYVGEIDAETKNLISYTLTEMLKGGCKILPANQKIEFPIGRDGKYPKLRGEALNTLQAFYSNNPGSHPASSGIPEGHIIIKNFLSVPVVFNNQLVGQIALANASRDYTDTDLEAIKRLAEFYGLAINNFRNELSLIESEKRYRTLINNFPDYILVIQNNKVVFVSDENNQNSSFDFRQTLNKDFTAFVDKKYHEKIHRIIEKSVTDEDFVTTEIEIELIFTNIANIYNFRASAFNFNNQKATLVVLSDITYKKSTEEDRKHLFTHSLDLIGIFNFEKLLIEVNPAWEKTLGYEWNEIIHKPFYYLMDEDSKQFFQFSMEKIKSGQVLNQYETKFKCKNGDYKWISWNIFPIVHRRMVFAIGRDITSLKQLNEEINMALEREKELNLLKSQFISTVSHEFRTPLAGILTSTELLEKFSKNWDDSKKKKLYDQINNSVKHLTRLVDQVSIIGKDESGKLSLNLVTTNLHSFCSQVIEDITFSIDCKNLINYIIDDEEIKCKIDQSLMRQVLSNLLHNALKYSHYKKNVDFIVQTKQDEIIMFKITDYGIGIPEEDLKYIFEPFHRANNTENIQGTGLGMSVVKRCLDIQKGTITIYSKVGEGTTVKINIPKIIEV